MLVKDLINKLEEMDGDAPVRIVKNTSGGDGGYQYIYDLEYVMGEHPIGGVTLHGKDMVDKTSEG